MAEEIILSNDNDAKLNAWIKEFEGFSFFDEGQKLGILLGMAMAYSKRLNAPFETLLKEAIAIEASKAIHKDPPEET